MRLKNHRPVAAQSGSGIRPDRVLADLGRIDGDGRHPSIYHRQTRTRRDPTHPAKDDRIAAHQHTQHGRCKDCAAWIQTTLLTEAPPDSRSPGGLEAPVQKTGKNAEQRAKFEQEHREIWFPRIGDSEKRAEFHGASIRLGGVRLKLAGANRPAPPPGDGSHTHPIEPQRSRVVCECDRERAVPSGPRDLQGGRRDAVRSGRHRDRPIPRDIPLFKRKLHFAGRVEFHRPLNERMAVSRVPRCEYVRLNEPAKERGYNECG